MALEKPGKLGIYFSYFVATLTYSFSALVIYFIPVSQVDESKGCV